MNRLCLWVSLLGLTFASCDPDKDASGTFTGTSVTVRDGKLTPWVTADKDGNPTAMGVNVDAKALAALMADTMSQLGSSFKLNFPAQAATTNIDHLKVDWAFHGHPPVNIYTKPHFDLHFYLIPDAELNLIRDYNTSDSVKFKKDPPAGQIPAGYIHGEGGVPKMGAHWIDVTGPEFQGQPFTKTFIYGSFDAKVVFIEPMIAVTELQKGTTITADIKQPTVFAKAGYFPTKYSISKNAAGEHVLALEGFVKH